MAANTKTAFFGSMFAFEAKGVDDFIDRFRDSYASAPQEPPFMSYDPRNDVRALQHLPVLL